MISIQPEQLTSDDHVVFEFTGSTRACSEIIRSELGSVFTYEVRTTEGVCLSAWIPYQGSWNVGRLEAGEYEVIYIDQRDGEESQTFTVAQGTLPFPEPAIPTFGVIGAIVLAVALLLAAHKSFKWRDA